MTSKKADSPTGADTYKRLLGYAAPHWRVFIVAALGMALFALADVSFIYLVKPLLDGSFVEKDPFIIRIMPPAILGLFLLRGVSSFVSTYGMSWIGRRVIRDLRQELFDHLLCLPVSFYDRVPSSALITRLSYHVEQVAESTTTVVTTVLKEGLTVIGLIGLMFHLDWRLTLFTIIVGPIIAVLILRNGLFALSELAIVSARGPRLQAAEKRGSSSARIARELGADPGRFLSTVQVGITLIGILAGA